jgi:GPH family glycoside/pentoside/hexuronide:cation symporter
VSAAAALPPSERLPFRVKLGNGFGSIAYGVKDNGFASLLLPLYNLVLGLDAPIIGLILLIALFMDAIIDPLVGYWSDKTHSRWGKRHPWMYGSILPMAFAWIMLWHPPQLEQQWLYGYLLLFAFLMRAAVSCYEIPALSVVPALTSDYDERTSLTRWRFVFGWAGGLVMLTLAFGFYLVPSEKYPVGQLNLDGYQLYGWTGAVLMILATSVSAWSTHSRLAHPDSAPPTHLPLGQTLRKIGKTLSNKAFLVLLGSSVFAFVNQGLTFSITFYLLSYYWEMPQTGFIAYSATLFVGVVGSFLVVGLLQKRMEKRTGAVAAGILALCFGLSPYLLRFAGLFPANGDALLIPILFTVITISNAFSVASMMLAQSMASDIVEASQEQTGERSEGIFFSAYFFVQKCATGVGLFLTGQIIGAAGLPAQATPGQVGQGILDDLAFYFLIALTFFAVASIYFISRFPISRADHEARIAALAVSEASSETTGLQ